jgi:hypothetical protein
VINVSANTLEQERLAVDSDFPAVGNYPRDARVTGVSLRNHVGSLQHQMVRIEVTFKMELLRAWIDQVQRLSATIRDADGGSAFYGPGGRPAMQDLGRVQTKLRVEATAASGSR